MEPHEGRWHEVAPGAYILDRDGATVWKVVAERTQDGQELVLLEQRDGTRRVVVRPGSFEPVTFMLRTLEETEAMVAERLGATLLARAEKGKVVQCVPVPPKSKGDHHSHFFFFHGVVLGQDHHTAKQLAEMHEDMHATAAEGYDLHGYIHHEHTTHLRPLGATA